MVALHWLGCGNSCSSPTTTGCMQLQIITMAWTCRICARIRRSWSQVLRRSTKELYITYIYIPPCCWSIHYTGSSIWPSFHTTTAHIEATSQYKMTCALVNLASTTTCPVLIASAGPPSDPPCFDLCGMLTWTKKIWLKASKLKIAQTVTPTMYKFLSD